MTDYRMTYSDKELIDEMVRGLRAEIRANNDIIMLQLGQIIDQTTKTNSRVTKLEDETGIGRWFERKPKRFFILLIIVAFFSMEGISSIIERIIKLL